MAAALTAVIPRPSESSLCPGRTVSESSGSGAPMNTDGTKSTKEWTVAADMMQQDIRTGVKEGSQNPDTMPSMRG